MIVLTELPKSNQLETKQDDQQITSPETSFSTSQPAAQAHI